MMQGKSSSSGIVLAIPTLYRTNNLLQELFCRSTLMLIWRCSSYMIQGEQSSSGIVLAISTCCWGDNLLQVMFLQFLHDAGEIIFFRHCSCNSYMMLGR